MEKKKSDVNICKDSATKIKKYIYGTQKKHTLKTSKKGQKIKENWTQRKEIQRKKRKEKEKKKEK